MSSIGVAVLVRSRHVVEAVEFSEGDRCRKDVPPSVLKNWAKVDLSLLSDTTT
ncbi:uncharacterized protein PGTG_22724 [Puccinia graminis f. sp. tritici CRL 75-36-700-3]|uniref:Uncharacterized protein n=1 Tax=Puccinia graminis f. sp. tritici (strain CRL 75-36-700-3 / race SCCL) TaxID=418459 RepID=H6QVE9_PUCGT|nr:uncharacterized protein PGTG_22724 [Puccinia graminis f. sp. tritici CRL 75-36-700-3]EHS62903.1 hypothetical protein PGTG_22724 [Puccinia graminis f. sp. tritici CRL 75-36-700-3]